MDKEWRRRQALVGRLQYRHHDAYDLDVRLGDFADIRNMDWSYERIYKLITMDGMSAKPEAHQGFVENPLVAVDYVTVSHEGQAGHNRSPS